MVLWILNGDYKMFMWSNDNRNVRASMSRKFFRMYVDGEDTFKFKTMYLHMLICVTSKSK